MDFYQRSVEEKRREPRILLSAFTLPFYGARMRDFLKFQYLLIDASPSGAQFTCPEILTRDEELQKGDEINFFVPILAGDNVLEKGRIVWIKQDEDVSGKACGASAQGYPPSDEFLLVQVEKEGEYIFLKPIQLPEFRWFVLDGLMDALKLKSQLLDTVEKLLLHYPELAITRPRGASGQFMPLAEIREMIAEDVSVLTVMNDEIGRLDDPLQSVARYLEKGEIRRIIESEAYDAFLSNPPEKEIPPALIDEVKRGEQRFLFHYNSVVIASVLVLG